MLKSLSQLEGALLSGTDGDIGHVREAFFDDRSWTLRYLLVETGDWLQGRKLLLSTQAMQQPLAEGRHLQVELGRRQLQASPPLDSSQPPTRLQERGLLRHYRLAEYWASSDEDFDGAAQHLRRSSVLKGYEISASDAGIGHVRDFVFDASSWVLRYLVVDTSGWWKDGHRVLIGMQWTDEVDTVARQLHVRLTRAQVKSSPPYDDEAPLHRDDETLLHKNYERAAYWM